MSQDQSSEDRKVSSSTLLCLASLRSEYSSPMDRCTAGLVIPCDKGHYNPITGANNQTACRRCPEHSTTLSEGSISIGQCLCEPGFEELIGDSGITCVCARGYGIVSSGTERCDRENPEASDAQHLPTVTALRRPHTRILLSNVSTDSALLHLLQRAR